MTFETDNRFRPRRFGDFFWSIFDSFHRQNTPQKRIEHRLTPKSTESESVNNLLEVKNFSVSYSINGLKIRAVENVTFTLKAKERVGLVGESGCGKTALITALLGLDPAQKIKGSALFEGVPAPFVRGREIGMVFQDPMASLNPTMK